MYRDLFLNRRNALAGGAAALVGLAASGANTAMASVRTGGGVAGGGLVDFGASTAQFSVLASRFQDDETDDLFVIGSVIWADAAGFTLTSAKLLTYGPDPIDAERGRIITGYFTRSDNDNTHAFRMRLVEASGPGEGKDQVELLVGGAVEMNAEFPDLIEADAMINIKSEISIGDIQLIEFDFTIDNGTPT
jgi:hypothetical protein